MKRNAQQNGQRVTPAKDAATPADMSRWLKLTARKTATAAQSGNAAGNAAADAITAMLKRQSGR